MKKVWKGAAAAIAALSLGATGFMGVTSAYADEVTGGTEVVDTTSTSPTITINDDRTGHAYKAYQIFTGSLAAINNQNTLGQLEWGNGVTATGKAAIINAINATIDEDADKLPADATAAAVGAALANGGDTLGKAVAKALMASDCLQNGTALAYNETNKNYSGAVAANGYYLINDQDTDPALEGDDQYTSFILKVAGTATADPKRSQPTVDKKVQDEAVDKDTGDGDDAGWGSSADHSINEKFNFKLTATLPADANRADYDTYKVVFNDTMSEGVTFDRIVSVKVNGTAITAHDREVDGQNAQKWSLTIADVTPLVQDITAAINIEVIYEAHLNEKAQVLHEAGDIKNTNSVNLQYSNNPAANGLGKTEDKTVYVATFSVNNTKRAESTTGAALQGAGFRLYDSSGVEIKLAKDATDNKYYPAAQDDGVEMTSDAEGKFNIKGLDAGTYTIKETTVPDGYNKMDDFAVTVRADHATNRVTSISSDSTMDNNMVNKKGFNLPETGGMGTVVLYTAGVAIVLIAGIGLTIALRRRQA